MSGFALARCARGSRWAVNYALLLSETADIARNPAELAAAATFSGLRIWAAEIGDQASAAKAVASLAVTERHRGRLDSAISLSRGDGMHDDHRRPESRRSRAGGHGAHCRLSEVTVMMEVTRLASAPGRRGGVVDQPDLTGAVVDAETAEPPVARGWWCVVPGDAVICERRSGVFEPPSLIPAVTLRTSPSWRADE